MTRVKICGVNSAAAFDAACEAGADWVGFVFYAGSPRAVTPWMAAGLSARAEGGPGRVGLFVEPLDADIEAVLRAMRPDVLQVYAGADRIKDIAGKFGIPVWRSCAVSGRGDLPERAGAASAVVIEARAPAGEARPGGHGVAMDWEILRGWQPGFDWVLAGGLNVGNVAEAVRVSGAPAVDVSSGVERRAGEKDAGLVREFVRVVRNSRYDT